MTKSNLKIKRIQAGLTQFQLAEKLGLKERVITLYETNRATPRTETMVDIARILSVDPAEIWPDEFSKISKEEEEVIDKAIAKFYTNQKLGKEAQK